MSGYDPYSGINQDRCTEDPTLVPQDSGGRRAADLDPVPLGQLQSTTIIAALTGIGAMLATFGVKWGVDESQKKEIAEGVLAIITLGSFVWAWIGRVRATKQVSATRLLTDASKNLPVLLTLLFCCTGCLGNLKQSPVIQLYTAKQAWATTLDEFRSAVDSNLITSPTVLKSAYTLIPEVNKTLDDATVKAKSGDSIGYQFLWEQLQDKLTRFYRLQAPANRSPSSYLMERELCPLRYLLPSSLTPSAESSNSSGSSRFRKLAASSPTSRWLWSICTSSSPLTQPCSQS